MAAFSVPAFRRVVWLSALYDAVVTAPFATPWTFAFNHAQLSTLNQALGGPPLPAFAAVQMLFALLMGSVVLVWAALRLRGPSLLLGRHDAVARLLFAGWMAWACAQGGAPVLLLFIVPELAWAAVQLWPVRSSLPG